MSVFAARRRKDKDKKRKDKAHKEEKAKKEKKEKKEVPEANFSPAEKEEVEEAQEVKKFYTKPKIEHADIFTPAKEEKPEEVKAEEPTAEPVKRGRKKSQKVKMREFQIYQAVRSAGDKGIKKGDLAEQTGVTNYLIYQALKTLEANGQVELIEGTRFWRATS